MADKPESEPQSAELVTEETTCSIEQICLSCGADETWITSIVEYGIISPVGGRGTPWRFSGYSVVRAAKAHRLARDLDLNVPGTAVAIELLDEIERLRARLKALGH